MGCATLGCELMSLQHISISALSFVDWKVREGGGGLTVESLQAMLARVNSVHSLKVRDE